MKELEIYIGKNNKNYILFLRFLGKTMQKKQINHLDRLLREIKNFYDASKFDCYSIKPLKDTNFSPEITPIGTKEFGNLKGILNRSLEGCVLLSNSYSITEGIPD